jgi:hypothetical protein
MLNVAIKFVMPDYIIRSAIMTSVGAYNKEPDCEYMTAGRCCHALAGET